MTSYIITFTTGTKAVVEAPSKEVAQHVIQSNYPHLEVKRIKEGEPAQA